ncbi:PP2C family protein-serine/threonine phosphatase [Microbacterium koreense]|uniref:PP2C family protein-serine/threonine phosphatase n=1 Tax=Microbacterium koreense TaxID=323761 RepID=A0ABW2ZSU8_9MICO
MVIRLRVAGASDVGPHRAVNQDAAFTASWGAAVADGVGGGPSGDLASAALVHRLVPSAGIQVTGPRLVERLREANWDLRALVERDASLTGMATTFTGVFVSEDGGLLLAHSGDSRAYRLRDGELVRLSRDDSYVQALVDNGVIAPEEAQNHPKRNIITASFGGAERDLPAVSALDVAPGDRLLLCSDGLTDYVPEADVLTLVQRGGVVEAAQALVNLAIEASTRDNVTAIVCDIDEGAPDDDEPIFLGSAAERFNESLESA